MGAQLKYMKRLHNKGFTFIEMILAFSIFLIIVSLFPLFFQVISQNGFVEERIQKMEWEVFIAQVKKEVRMSDSLKIENNRIMLKIGKESIMYERYGTNIRRRVDAAGHEIMLQDIKTVMFEKVIKGVRISVEDKYNQSESVIIRSVVDEESLYAAP
ncbi:competence type IV pilus minor pilin ComGF [Niallia endozanthoxylica]|nr:competence type IV pilus minor pilin ComGF [Niallia endozanthoxylica]